MYGGSQISSNTNIAIAKKFYSLHLNHSICFLNFCVSEHPNLKYKTMVLCKISLKTFQVCIKLEYLKAKEEVAALLCTRPSPFCQKSSLMKFLKNAGSQIPIKKGRKKNARRILFYFLQINVLHICKPNANISFFRISEKNFLHCYFV